MHQELLKKLEAESDPLMAVIDIAKKRSVKLAPLLFQFGLRLSRYTSPTNG